MLFIIVTAITLKFSVADVSYLLAFPKAGSSVTVVTGQKGGWAQLRFLSLASVECSNIAQNSRETLSVKDKLTTTNGIENSSISLHLSDSSLDAYGTHEDFVFSPLPISALGQKYVLCTCTPKENYTTLFTIATLEQTTSIEITFRVDSNVIYDGNQYGDGETLSLNLTKYQTFTISSEVDFTGTVINSNDSVAVFVGLRYNNDVVAYDQMLPVQLHGSEYAIAVDDNQTPYQLQFVSADPLTEMTFNEGYKVLLDQTRRYRKTLWMNEAINLNTSKPVMATLCRLADNESGFTVVPSIQLGIKQRMFYNKMENLRILIERISDELYVNGSVTWNDLPSSKFQVGMSSDTEFARSNVSFTALGFGQKFLYNGGYSGLSVPFVTREDQVYLLAHPEEGDVDAAVGEEPGWYQIYYPKIAEITCVSISPYYYDAHSIYSSMATTEGIETKSIIVYASDEKVSIFGYEDYYFSPLLIRDLGTRYLVSSFVQTSGYSSVLLVAAHGLKTPVNITFRMDGNVTYENTTYTDGESLVIELDEFQTFTIYIDSDISGTLVTSDATVGVLSGRYDGSEVIALEQMIPVTSFGKEYVIAVDDQPPKYELRIIGEDSDTEITFNNGSTAFVGDPPYYRRTMELNEILYFNSTKPVMASLVRYTGSESGFLVIPPLTHGKKQTSLYDYSQNVRIIIQENVTDVKASPFDGNDPLNPISWETIPGTGYKVGSIATPSTIESNSSFVLLAYDDDFIYNGGYVFPNSETYTTPESTSTTTPSTTKASTTSLSTTITSKTQTTSSSVLTTHSQGQGANDRIFDARDAVMYSLSAGLGVVALLTLAVIVIALRNASKKIREPYAKRHPGPNIRSSRDWKTAWYAEVY